MKLKTQKCKSHLKNIGACGLLVSMCLTGCADYSLAKVNPNENKIIQISETDSKMLLTQAINKVLVSKVALDNQLIIYLEDTVKPTSDMKESLITCINEVNKSVNENMETVSLLQVSQQSAERQQKTVEIFKEMSKCLTDMLSDIEQNDFSKLKEAQTRYYSVIQQLQSLSIG